MSRNPSVASVGRPCEPSSTYTFRMLHRLAAYVNPLLLAALLSYAHVRPRSLPVFDGRASARMKFVRAYRVSFLSTDQTRRQRGAAADSRAPGVSLEACSLSRASPVSAGEFSKPLALYNASWLSAVLRLPRTVGSRDEPARVHASC